jgi:hypothetical protein
LEPFPNRNPLPCDLGAGHACAQWCGSIGHGATAELHRFCPDVVDRVTSRAILCVVLDLPQLIYVECRSLRVVCRAEWDQAFGSMMMFDTPLRVEVAGAAMVLRFCLLS